MFAPPVKVTKPKAASHAAPAHAPKAPQYMPSRPGLGSAEQMLPLQRTIGNQAVLRLLSQQAESLTGDKSDDHRTQEVNSAPMAGLRAVPEVSWDFSKIPVSAPDQTSQPQTPSPLIQPKLKVGQVNDPLEQEADRVSDQVLRMSAPEVSIPVGPQQISRKCEACDEERQMLRQTMPAGPQAPPGKASSSVHEVLRSPGQPLDAEARAYFEPRFGFDFSRVRMHTDARPDLATPAGAPRFSAKPPPNLPTGTPAWTQDGTTYLGVPWLFANSAKRIQILRHEAVHSLHQRLAPRGETASDRAHAENVAAKAVDGFGGISLGELSQPVPALLGFAPQTFSPWTRVFIGFPGIVGEIFHAGVTVRIFLSYQDLALPKDDGLSYVCGSRPIPGSTPQIPAKITDVVPKMTQVAAKTAEFNALSGDTQATERVSTVLIYSEPADPKQSLFLQSGGRGLIRLSKQDFDAGHFEDALAHESAHAVLWHHMGNKAPGEAAPDWKPDALALRVADVHRRLKETKPVPLPDSKKRFDPADPPPLVRTEGAAPGATLHPAGIVMVTDSLWSQSGGGHPWDNFDEFFTSSLAGFLQQPTLFRQTIDYYARADERIAPLAKELLELLAIAKDPGKLKSLQGPGEPAAAQQELASFEPPPEVGGSVAELEYLINPSSLPSLEDKKMPPHVRCPEAPPSPSPAPVSPALPSPDKERPQ